MPNTTTDKTIIHTDAARGERVSGLGYTIDGDVSLDGNKYMVGTFTSMEAELHALLEGVRLATQHSGSRRECEVYIDVKPLKHKICGTDEIREDWRQYQQSARWLLDKYDSWTIEHCSRSHNTAAHDLAREALFEGREYVGIE